MFPLLCMVNLVPLGRVLKADEVKCNFKDSRSTWQKRSKDHVVQLRHDLQDCQLKIM